MIEDRFHKLIVDLHVGVIVQGPRAEILLSNPAARALLGMAEDELTGITSYDPRFKIIREDGQPFLAEDRPVATVLRTRAAVRNVVIGVVRPDEGIRWVLVHAVPELDPSGEVAQVLATLADITDRKLLEASLRESQKLESIGRLAGGVAHDFNNLLTVITGCTELALRSLPKDSEARRDLKDALDAAARASALTRQLLTFARRQPSSPVTLQVAEALAKVEPLLTRLLGDAIPMRVTIAPDAWHVCVDPSQLEQALMNLVVNARDAMPDGGTLRIDGSNAHATDPRTGAPGDYVCLAISDTGAGMDEATRGRIFEPFFTSKGVGQGTGLGLATTHGIVERHGGFIVVESKVGQGSTFRVFLPRIDAPTPPVVAALPAPVRGRAGEVVLVVEDDSFVRRATVRTLQEGGYTVVEAGGGEEALSLLRARGGEIRLVVSDVLMPNLDGPALARAAAAAGVEVPFLFMSGYSEQEVPVALGRFIAKPFGAEELLRVVHEAIVGRTPSTKKPA